MSRPITLSFTEVTITKLNQYLPRGEKSAFIEQAVIEKLNHLRRGKQVKEFLTAIRSVPPSRVGTSTRLLRRQRRAH